MFAVNKLSEFLAMTMIKKILSDVALGKNIDLYLSLVLVIAYIVAQLLESIGLAGIGVGKHSSSLIVSLFGVMAVSTLKTRAIDEEVLSEIYKQRNNFIHSFPERLKSDIEKSRTIRIVAVTLDIVALDEYESIFSSKLKLGHKIEILLVTPGGAALSMAATRARWEGEKALQRRIISHIETLSAINDENENKIAIKTINSPLSYSAISVEREDFGGCNKIYLAHYPYKTERVREPKHVLRDGRDPYYELFMEELGML